MNERIENTYTRSGRIANPTEQGSQCETYTGNILKGISNRVRKDIFHINNKNNVFLPFSLGILQIICIFAD